MELRPELMPPPLDEALVARLAKLGDAIDGALPGQCEDKLAEFNRLANTSIAFRDFQGVYGAENHANWVRRLLWSQRIRPADGVTREELIEVLIRADPRVGINDENEAYMAIFDANVPLPKASMLLYYPPEEDGTEDKDWDPTPEQIVDLALRGKTAAD
jgi:hypothetical protein